MPYLDSLRGLAALLVVFHHALFQSWSFPEADISPGFAPWISWLKYGHFSVTFFIVLSGFVIALPFARKLEGDSAITGISWRTFFYRRARRILPPYYAALVFSAALLVWYHGWKGINGTDLIGHLLLLHDWGLGNRFAINGPMWSIPVEWHIYFTFPLLFLLWRRVGVNWGTVAWIASAYTIFSLLPKGELRSSAAVHYYGVFAMGAATAVMSQSRAHSVRTFLIWGIMLIAGSVWAGMTFGFGWQWFLDHDAWCDLAFGIFAAAGILLLTTSPSGFQRVLSKSLLVRLGAMSYSLYLVHGPLLRHFDGKFVALYQPDAGTKFLLLSGLAVPGILVAAWIFHLVFERPFLSTPRPRNGTAVAAN